VTYANQSVSKRCAEKIGPKNNQLYLMHGEQEIGELCTDFK